MRFFAPLLAAFAAVAVAQQQNAINIPPEGLQVSADQPVWRPMLHLLFWTDIHRPQSRGAIQAVAP